ncbi:proline racemase family protein [Nocardia terpenica]|uniref:proline racemase family protein n=1 Tax=Nocardia terpenica TaxID=455432 RepID=UPI001896049E|nr:proline racemase family protein [Nocardia terpenica]MBF6065771.1 proline racemase family protein [Nocardia terpenica]MBF6108466.1 proline racemase family protein [Nocardia terpenica]MBF6115886.1 proline racemase family protein [Nocardia terpenica]MBF6123016.1 proline racemase family protein [Nocardia terpenica]MBF6156310.1 proline racemase family protein [Nocardia terpenica]
MRSSRIISAIDTHTEGMPTRVVTGGIGTVPGDTMAARRTYFQRHLDGLRTLLMYEPRGHAAMSGAILQPATTADGQYGVLFIEVSGLLPMCGHGSIGVATALVESGMVPVAEPTTEIRLDTPAGRVVAEVAVSGGHADAVTLRNVPAYCDSVDNTVDVPGLGTVRYDMAYGGNFYAIVGLDGLGIPFDRAHKDRILDAGLRIMAAVNDTRRPTHPGDERISGCKHVLFLDPASEPAHTRHAMAIHPGWFDRSPCGTGTSALLARQHARGLLSDGEVLRNDSFLGTTFHARALETTTVGGHPAIVPALTGRAWVTGIGTYLLDPTDPFPEGFLF